jgi:hypothetical protein
MKYKEIPSCGFHVVMISVDFSNQNREIYATISKDADETDKKDLYCIFLFTTLSSTALGRTQRPIG